jgi:hypothetical protein
VSTAAVRPRTGSDARTGRRAGHAVRERVAPRPEPWGRGDALLTALLTGLGLVGLVIGWYGISGTVDLDSQMRWLAFGITALIVGGAGMVLWLLAALRSVTDLKREVLTELEARLPAAAVAAAPAAVTGFGTVQGMRRYHHPQCTMLAGKDVRWADAKAHAAAGLAPCGICLATPAADPRGEDDR